MKSDKADQQALALWAAECAEHVLSFFEAHDPDDDRPQRAIEAARAWACGELTCGEARTAALDAHAAARDANDPSACAAARAAGHASATAHVAGHARHAAAYAVKAARFHARPNEANCTATAERIWQIQHLPQHLRSVGFVATHR